MKKKLPDFMRMRERSTEKRNEIAAIERRFHYDAMAPKSGLAERGGFRSKGCRFSRLQMKTENS
jgi:hypothetical protein